MSDVTDWIGAIGNSVAAIGTAGALLLGVRVYFRQERDQRRAQAAAVTVGHRTEDRISGSAIPREYHQHFAFIRNDSSLPIYHVLLYIGPQDDRKTEVREVLPAGEEASLLVTTTNFMPFAKFVDTSGVSWKRDGAGRLSEIKDEHGLPWNVD